MATFKASLRLPDKSTRVISLARTDDYKGLEETVATFCSGNFRLKYTDEDGDKVTIGSTDELVYAFTESPDGLEIIVEMEGGEQPFIQLEAPESNESIDAEKGEEILVVGEVVECDVDSPRTVPEIESVTVEVSTPMTEKKAAEVAAPAEEHTPTEEKADILTLGTQFMSNPEFRKILASNMDSLMRFVGGGEFDDLFEFLKNEAAAVPTLSAHPFFVAISEPSRFHVVREALSGHLRSASTSIALLLQAMFPQAVNTSDLKAKATVSVGVEASFRKSVQTESVQTEAPELKSVQAGPETPVFKSVQAGPCEEMKQAAARAAVRSIVESVAAEAQPEPEAEAKPESQPEGDEKKLRNFEAIKASAKKDGFMINVGGGNFIKWQFLDAGIPSVKYFKHGWDHSSEIKEGYRLVRINDTWLWNRTKNEVQTIWLDENGGGAKTILYFMSLSKIHPCEEHHDGLKMVMHMGFSDVRKLRALFARENGNMENVVSALLK